MSAFTTLARTYKSGQHEKPARAYLIPLNGFKSDERMDDKKRSFQYFPSTISDSHATNYQTKVIPGLSHPLYQWTSGGARTISFEAIFTRDRAYFSSEKESIKKSGQDARENKISSISVNTDSRNVDIPSAVAWLRSFLLPEYSADDTGKKTTPIGRPLPPQKLILGIPGVRINFGVPSMVSTEINCIMTQCDVSYDGFFYDGSPRMAKVNLSFAEIIQVGGRIRPQDGFDKRSVALSGYVSPEGNRRG